ncbi:TNF receptor-associated factor 3-like [Biomphalaria glabrata]|uniref:TNF receptor-associated factor 3-like n=1 Tax=Biomphalaria glabrata TaxID=6526 RepID=A0A9W2ZXZ1_BIOGL|nr:TNF receptor-associated factor 3-like [Biomphalaria glabrata]XP_055879887.1 TNF receptor-associated factor 3-like [Biomphalaria glabrata]XP_055879888.1 TNF receptor-associated factor 3-like [Biomphalaria glabrata]
MSNGQMLGATASEVHDGFSFTDPSGGDSGPTSGNFTSLSLSLVPEDDPILVNPDPKYFCPVHGGLLREAVQTECGHRLCQACVGLYLGSDKKKRCPANEEDCSDITKENILPDPGFRREIKQLAVYCPFKGKGCKVTVKFGLLNNHTKDCEYRDVRCIYSDRGCNQSILFKDADTHNKMCPCRPVFCELCNQEFNASEQKKHEDSICPAALIDCPFLCGIENLKRSQLADHEMVCPKRPSECKFKSLGCPFMGDSETIRAHEQNIESHFEVVCEFALKSEINRMREKEYYEQMLGTFIRNSEQLSNTVKSNHRDLKLKMVQQVERLIILEQKNQQYETTIAGLRQEMQNLQQSIEQLKVLITQVSNAERQVASHEIRMAEMDLRFQMLETASYDGKLLWKIRDFSHRKRDAVQGRTVSLYSQPFYTGRFGYKMCARVYLNGDGIGRGTHMSLYFVVMKGEYDALLSWPFQHRVSLILMDQSPEKRHLKDEFFPDPNSTSFRRPMAAEMNVASGCPLFVAHTVLDNPSNNYVKDDTLFIKIAVDVTNLTPI